MKIFLEFVLVLLALQLNKCFSRLETEPEEAQNEIWPYVKYIFPYPVQSPVDVITANAEKRNLNPLKIYFPWDSAEVLTNIENTGSYLEILLSEEVENRPYVTGGSLLEETYLLEQFHFHWGKTDECGSENWLDGKCFTTEIHAVYYNEKYGSLSEAVNYPDGVAVVATFGELNLENSENDFLKYLTAKLSEVIQPGSKTTASMNNGLRFLEDISKQKIYYTFPGSLTTPSFSECVTWIVLPKPFHVSPELMTALRKLIGKDGQPLKENVRPLQDFNNRPLLVEKNQSN